MNELGIIRRGPRLAAAATVAGAVAGATFAISPMTVLAAVAVVSVAAWAGADLGPRERRWVVGILAAAIAVRTVALIAMFFYVSHPHLFSAEVVTDVTGPPLLSVFGDETYAKRRSLWMRDIWLGMPVAPENYTRAFEQYGWTGYFHVVAYLQMWLGPMPFGVHLMNAAVFLGGAVALFRCVRRAYGSAAATSGLAVVVFLPTWFVWSISALKESLYFCVGAAVICLWGRAARPGPLATRLGYVVAGAFAATALGLIRPGAGAIAFAAAITAAAGHLMLHRPRGATAVAAAAIVGLFALCLPSAGHRITTALHATADRHRANVEAAGVGYRLLDDRFYDDKRLSIETITVPETARYLANAIVSFACIPFPGQLGLIGLALVPSQVLWLTSLILVPWGIAAGLRRDSYLTLLLLAYAAFTTMAVALNSGNVGTLIRHRDAVVPFVMWVSALGAVERLRHWVPQPRSYVPCAS